MTLPLSSLQGMKQSGFQKSDLMLLNSVIKNPLLLNLDQQIASLTSQ